MLIATYRCLLVSITSTHLHFAISVNVFSSFVTYNYSPLIWDDQLDEYICIVIFEVIEGYVANITFKPKVVVDVVQCKNNIFRWILGNIYVCVSHQIV